MADCNHDCDSCSSKCGKESFLVKQNELSNVKRVIGVVSGKGGVGKSLVTALLAVGAARSGKKVAVLDADITGPSIPRSFGVNRERAESMDGQHILPVVTRTGIKVMSLNFLIDDETNPVTNGASNMQYIDWKVTVGDISTTGNFAISPAYVNNSTVTVGTTLSGTNGMNLNTSALADTDNNPETASVRTSVVMVWEDGAYVVKARVYNSSDKTYSFYDVETVSISLKVIAIDGDSESDVTASIFDANGGFNAAGTYRVEFALTTGDAVYNFTTTYTVNAAQA